MALTPENLRFILGLKVKSLRQRQGLSLTELAENSGLSVSYLSEIERGRKFPKPDKLIGLADALAVGYQDLVSPQLSGELDAFEALFDSDFLTEFPFDLFGLEAADLLGLVSDDPVKAAAFVQTFLEIGQSYDMQVEQFLFAALRSYQRLHSNYFPELEEAATRYRRSRGWAVGKPLEDPLREILEEEYGYVVEEEGLAQVPELDMLRSVFLDGDPPRLLLNPRLAPSQRAFIYGREIGFHVLDVPERATTSTWVEVKSFDQILSNFKASYFSGALLVDGDALTAALEEFWSRERWSSEAYLEMMKDFNATAEMFAYRLTEILPGRLGLENLYFMRFHHPIGTDEYDLNKILNLTGMAVPRGVGLSEHYCRRWVTLRLLQDLESGDLRAGPEPRERGSELPVVRAERARFVREDAEFFVIAAAQPLKLEQGKLSCITLGFLMDDAFTRRAGFSDDPELPSWEVGITCERCPIPASDCSLRKVPPVVLKRAGDRRRQIDALNRLREEGAAAFR